MFSCLQQFHEWEKELLGASLVNIHSKVIVLDPFGTKPVVMTDSHTLGYKAYDFRSPERKEPGLASLLRRCTAFISVGAPMVTPKRGPSSSHDALLP
jgi:hypothetical protein